MADLSLIFVLAGKKPASKCPIACARVGRDSAGTTLHKSELKVSHTTVDELWNTVKPAL